LLGTVSVLGCGESSAPACATQIADEVCSTPAQLRGAEPVQGSATSNASVQLPPAPLAEGRYVLASLVYACPGGEEPSPARPSLQGVLELSGCVLRRTLVAEGQEPAQVDVFELGYAGEGTLALQPRCPLAEAGALQAAYGFDGERLELGPLQATGQAPDEAACATLETWELR
jgi:hypothetical protein